MVISALLGVGKSRRIHQVTSRPKDAGYILSGSDQTVTSLKTGAVCSCPARGGHGQGLQRAEWDAGYTHLRGNHDHDRISEVDGAFSPASPFFSFAAGSEQAAMVTGVSAFLVSQRLHLRT